ncbi:MAG: hypothetical protein O3A21_01585 [Proteobacteria bacterium]|nr:hypothetical protein [Pseudomonadota bacterium]
MPVPDSAKRPVANVWLARGAAVLVLIGAAANGLGALALPKASLAYKPGRLGEWFAVNLTAPSGAEWGAILFTAGVLMMVPVACALAKLIGGPLRGLAVIGAALMAVAGLVNGLATMLPFVLSTQLAPVIDMSAAPAPAMAIALLGVALAADAVAIGCLGAGIILAGLAMAGDPLFGRGLGGLGVIAGLAVLPMALEANYDWAAQWVLWGSIPLLAWLLWLAGQLWRLPAAGVQASP